MTSTLVPFLEEETIDKMAYIRKLRKDYGFQIFFTIDAGSNIHLICEEKNQEKYKPLKEH